VGSSVNAAARELTLHCAGGGQVDLFKYGNLRVGKMDNSDATDRG
jgi:hypothetical protein